MYSDSDRSVAVGDGNRGSSFSLTANLRDLSVPAIIDVWSTDTFDPDLQKFLESHATLIRAYFDIDNAIFLSYDLGRGHPRPVIRPENPHASNFYRLLEDAGRLMTQRTIRAFHYTRLR